MYIYISYAVNPSEFYGFVSADNSFTNVPNIIVDTCNELWASGQGSLSLSDAFTRDRNFPKHFMIKMTNHQWFRCSNIQPDTSKVGYAKVILNDAGKRQISIPLTCPAVRMTRSISSFMAFQFSLADVEPLVGNTWTKAAGSAFASFTIGKVFLVPDYGSSKSITLRSIEDGKSVAENLGQLGYAKATKVKSFSGHDSASTSNLPIESLVFLERSGGVDVSKDDHSETPIIHSEILKALASLPK